MDKETKAPDTPHLQPHRSESHGSEPRGSEPRGSEPHRSGYVAIIGKPNAGKSTLMNAILGTKLSITTRKPQTTRHQIVGIHSDEDSQIIFLDTPGVITPEYELQKAMMASVQRAKTDADLILFITDPTDSVPGDEVIDLLRSIQKPMLLIINKTDKARPEQVEALQTFVEKALRPKNTLKVSALRQDGIESLMDEVKRHLPYGPALYSKEDLSEHPMRFFVAEFIREQIFLLFHDEIPYSCTVEVIRYQEQEDLDRISADIIVNRKSQKGMLIGKGGSAIKRLGIQSRKSIEAFTGRQAFLELHVKVREKWREKEGWVRSLGYGE
ncbi:MAG: GTPase Era [Bacteroidetes bacterium]|nr:MAG: GTPase Era [Bacteroidota bacterium]